MSERSLELKVGALILVALAMLAAFIVVLGGLSFEPKYAVFVDFDNPGGLQVGAPIRISGVKVGAVEQMDFRAGQLDEATGQPASNIRVIAKIEERYRSAIHDNARFFVTSNGVLGEPFLAIEPGSNDRPPLPEEARVNGVSPPRLDLLLSESYELLHRAYVGITENEQLLSETFQGLRDTLKGSGDFLQRNSGNLDAVVSNVVALSAEARDTVAAARAQYIDGPRAERILSDAETTVASLREHLPRLLADGRETIANTKRITGVFGSDQGAARLERITDDVSATVAGARAITKSAGTITKRLENGEGTAGALLMDEALYDDLQELTRDLKHNPWKFFWKE